MRFIPLLSLFFVFSSLHGQNDEQKLRILLNSNLTALDDLYIKALKKNKITEDRISSFLEANKAFNKRFYVDGILYEIKDIIDGKPFYVSNQNQKSALATKTYRLHTGGSLGLNLDGENMLIGIWDGGKVLVNHVEFMNNQIPAVTRVTAPDALSPSAPTDLHATHVAGTMVAKGVDIAAKGMAPKANLVSYNWTNDIAEVISQISTNSLLLSNHSYGVPVLNDQGQLNAPVWMMGCYDTESRDWDQVAVNAPYYLMVTSAGNSGNDSYSGGLMNGYDKLTGEKNAKNNLVVANSETFVIASTGALISNTINSSSSQGPSDDGRIKPDITGDGTNVYSTVDTSPTTYGNLTGTSMASPNVSGTLLLLQEYFSRLSSGSFMRSATLKGLVCHTALDGGSVGPDAKFGWGLLDSEKAAVLMQKSFAASPTAVLSEITLNQGATYTYQVNLNTSQKLEATICWTDPVGIPQDGSVNSSIPALVNDLDLRIIKGSEVNFPWKLQLSNVAAAAIKGDNIVDNVEKVEVNNAVGTYTIQVTHKGTLANGSQPFSLVISGFDQSLSVSDFNALNFSLYPNPAKNILNVNLTTVLDNATLSIVDLQGRIVNTQSVVDTITTIDVANLQSGVYVVRIDSATGSYTKKFIKE
jgi:hypothetical protein